MLENYEISKWKKKSEKNFKNRIQMGNFYSR